MQIRVTTTTQYTPLAKAFYPFEDATTHDYWEVVSVSLSVRPVLYFLNDKYGRFLGWKAINLCLKQSFNEWRWSSRIWWTPGLLVEWLYQLILLPNLSLSCQGEFSANHPTIRIFWKVFHELPLEAKKKFLLFLTGSDRIPIMGMKALHLVIQSTSGGESYFPVAHTCFNLLDLPLYTSEEVMKERLYAAIEHNVGFSLVWGNVSRQLAFEPLVGRSFD